MAKIELAGLGHRYPGNDTYSLQPQTMVWEDGGAYALLGPSGCGKTTLLNIISGLLVPSEGRVLFDGRDVTSLPTERRNIAQVFQFPIIYDTMTVFDNLAFPLRNRKLAEPEVRSRVQEIAEILDLSADLKRRASGLSAEDKQRISLGRGLVRKDVAAVLFDEPLTVIDPHVKWLLRRQLKRIHHQLKLSLIYVTHDQIEALTFADRVVVMYQGQVVQMGTPQDLFETPAHTFVGHFIGSPGMNLLPCELNGSSIRIAEQSFAIDAALATRLAQVGKPLTLGVRPEFIQCAPGGEKAGLSAKVVRLEDLGTSKLLTVHLGGHQMKVKLGEHAQINADHVQLALQPARTMFYADDQRVA
ncbi:ABC transporter ATP-binding protein [Chitinimonas sp. BJB300]|uniref:ABC transporter ATP-binding protein n=1 Tax=Chitinimonas sp. BJB300 TaxID=1559339 RepID=UPI000C0E02E9|nr:ABC transporter ATP-binding protein [Chitinimonas sp. BJB300]PHV10935.1 ABC transporter ATP-binding protein [Chitinimonas sp. BJB300]TSJ86033.1 ABC transporter ATP-binding protein [Chitinimonas sp. BJB300]